MNQYTGIYRRCELLFIRNELERFGLQPLEGKVLNFLRRGSCTQEDVCAHFDMDKGRIARNLSELEEKGLVNDQPGQGRLDIFTTGSTEEYTMKAAKVGLDPETSVQFYPPMKL